MNISIRLGSESVYGVSEILVGLILKLHALEFTAKNHSRFCITAEAKPVESFGR
jgi:hypothetical protein